MRDNSGDLHALAQPPKRKEKKTTQAAKHSLNQ